MCNSEAGRRAHGQHGSTFRHGYNEGELSAGRGTTSNEARVSDRDSSRTQEPTPPAEELLTEIEGQAIQAIDLTADDEEPKGIKTEPAPGTLGAQHEKGATVIRDGSGSRVTASMVEDDDEDDLRDELREIQIRRKRRAIEKRKNAAARPGS